MAQVEKMDLAQLSSGNTIQTKKANFILTVNEASLPHYEDIKAYITGLKSNNYYLWCEHLGQENKHYHIYCQFKSSLKLSIKKLYGAHIEASYGSAQQNIAYLRCEDDKHKALGIKSIQIDEIGTARLTGGRTIKEVKAMSKEEREELPFQFMNTVRKLNEEEAQDIDVDDLYKDVEVYWIQGPSGVGKTCKAKEIIKENKEKFGTKLNMVKYDGSFWHGVGTAPIALYDDFRDSHMKPDEFINFIDYNVHPMNVKGSSKQNQYKLIIITTVQNIKRIYRNVGGEPRAQWLRRIKVIDMNPEYDEENLDIDISNL